MAIKKINGVDVGVEGIDSWGLNKKDQYICIYFRLNDEEFLEWVKKIESGYELELSKEEFVADRHNDLRKIVDIEDNAEYMEFLSSLYDYLQEVLKNYTKR